MQVQPASATISDMDLLTRFDDLAALRPPSAPHPDHEVIRRSVNRRIVEAMMLQWGFGGPIRCSVTPAVSAAIGLMIARNGYGSMAGAAIGTGIACLGPMFTRWHLKQYAENHPGITLSSMAESWKALESGQGDTYATRLERMSPGLASVPDGIRKRIGKLFIYLQNTASLQGLFRRVYTECLTASPALQTHALQGKQLLTAEAERIAIQERLELAHLRATVLEQEATIRALQINGAHDGQDVQEVAGRLDDVEKVVTHLLQKLQPLLAQLSPGQANITLMHMHIERGEETKEDGGLA